MLYYLTILFLEELSFMSGIICLVCAIILFLHLYNSKYKAEIAYIAAINILILSISCLLSGMVFKNMFNVAAQVIWLKLTVAFALFALATMVLFIHAFFENKLPKVYYFSLVLITIGLSVLSYFTIETKENIGMFFSYNISIRDILRIWTLLLMVHTIGFGIVNYRDLFGYKKLQFHYSLVAFAIFVTATVLFVIILPYSTGIKNLFVFMVVFPVIWSCMITYALVKQRLFEIKVVLFDFAKFIAIIILFVFFSTILFFLFRKIFLISTFNSWILSLLIIGPLLFSTSIKDRFSFSMKSILLKNRVNYEAMLTECSKTVIAIIDINQLLNYVIKTLLAAFKINRVAIFLKENLSDCNSPYKLYASSGIKDSLKSLYFENQKIISWLKANKKSYLLDRAYQTLSKSEFDELSAGMESFDTMLIVPLMNKNEFIGFISMDQKRNESLVFDIEDIELLEAMANQLSVAVINAIQYKELRESFNSIVRALAIIIENKEGYTIGHTDNVTKYAVAIAKELRLSDKEILMLAHASMLHDLGKIYIHDNILNKKGKLTAEEWIEMKTHPIKGAKILESMPEMKEIIEVIKWHHERYDGKGYPDGLKGEQIPYKSQILTIADSFDAMLSTRPYRSGNREKNFSIDEAVNELIINKGKQFNPEIVDAFINVLKNNPAIAKNIVVWTEVGC